MKNQTVRTQTISNFAFIVETVDRLTGYLFHQTSLVPVSYQDADITMTTLGVGTVDQHGVIRAVDKRKVDRSALAEFLKESNRILVADNSRLAA